MGRAAIVLGISGLWLGVSYYFMSKSASPEWRTEIQHTTIHEMYHHSEDKVTAIKYDVSKNSQERFFNNIERLRDQLVIPRAQI